ncbi:MAG: type II secretion system protein [Candidatus Woesearchaeota archaeon]
MSKFRKLLTNNSGFTLIELLVVIAVLGVLAGIVIPRITGVTESAKERALESAATSLENTLEMAIAEDKIDTVSIDDGDTWITWGDEVSATMKQPENIEIDDDNTDNIGEDNIGADYSVTLKHTDLNDDDTITVENKES